jgi:bifunctional non-homologous end joining protein LigD
MDTWVEVEGKKVKLTNLQKVLYPKVELTKAHVIEYYKKISSFLLPHLKNRPLVLKRYPKGVEKEGFFQKSIPQSAPNWVKRVSIYSEEEKKEITYVLCENLATLIWLANLASLEIHPWLSQVNSLECPDLIVFDLDPYGVSFNEVKRVAFLIKDSLEALGIECFCKTSGLRGVHIYVPIEPRFTYEEAKKFSRLLSLVLAQKFPFFVTSQWKVEKRRGVFIDWNQNVKGKTLVAPYSLRVSPQATISYPLSWDELEALKDPSQFNLKKVLESSIKSAWEDIYKKRADIQDALLALERVYKSGI